MVLDLSEDRPIPFDVAGVWDRLLRLGRSLGAVEHVTQLPDSRGRLRPIVLATGANTVAHAQNRGRPKQVVAVVVGNTGVTVTRGDIADRTVVLYASGPCTVELVVHV